MPNDRHIDWLLEGKEAWNKRRESQDFQPDFSSENFVEEFRRYGKLNHSGGVCLKEFNLSGAIFDRTNLSQVNFFGSSLQRARFENCLMNDTCFSFADLREAMFDSNRFGNVNFFHAKLKGADFTADELVGADLGGTRYWLAKLFQKAEEPAKTSFPKIHRIKSIADLIKIYFRIKTRYRAFEVYFRGERDRSWPLEPSIMRPSNDGTFKLRAHEGEMLRKLIANRPEDFRETDSALEEMVVAQHYGLKTRLLDVSRNPCVALFSACDPRDPAGNIHPNDMSGRIHVFAVPKAMIKTFESDTVSIIANFAKLDRSYQNLLLGKTPRDIAEEDSGAPFRFDYSDALRRLYHYIRQEKPQFEKIIDPLDLLKVFVVEPKLSFERIRAQEGAFIISAFHDRFEREQIQTKVKNLPVYEHEHIIVPTKRKERILEELNLLGFSRETLYPGLGEVADSILSLTCDFSAHYRPATNWYSPSVCESRYSSPAWSWAKDIMRSPVSASSLCSVTWPPS